MNQQTKDISTTRVSLVEKFAGKYNIDSEKLLDTLKATAFKQSNDSAITNEQMAALLIVADQYNLNPFTKELYAFPDKNSGIVPVVGIDGWGNIINSHPEFNGMEFKESEDSAQIDSDAKDCPEWIECIIHRKDRQHPISVREYIDECYRPPFEKNGYKVKGPWQSHTKRMLRHKAMIQCARVAFSFAGIYDPDEAERIIDGVIIEENDFQSDDTRDINDSLKQSSEKKADQEDESQTEEKKTEGPPSIDKAYLENMVKKVSCQDDIDLITNLNEDHLSGGEKAHITKLLNEKQKEFQAFD